MMFKKVLIQAIWVMSMLMCALTASAQSGTTPKHKHGDWYVGIGGGFSQSLAENATPRAPQRRNRAQKYFNGWPDRRGQD